MNKAVDGCGKKTTALKSYPFLYGVFFWGVLSDEPFLANRTIFCSTVNGRKQTPPFVIILRLTRPPT